MNHKITPKTYVIGYTVSLYITLTAYFVTVHHLLTRRVLIAALAGLALTQFVVQLIFFLHLNIESKPRWKLFVLLFMVMIVLIIVFGSLWIMINLNYHMTVQQMEHYLSNQDGL